MIWEQKGCPYCRETHRVNLADQRISSYVTANFEVLQLDLWGSRKVTDFDGKEMEERDLARLCKMDWEKEKYIFLRHIPDFSR